MSEQVIVGDGASLDILSASAVRAALTDIAQIFHGVSGIGVTLRFDTSGGINKRAAAGEVERVGVGGVERERAHHGCAIRTGAILLQDCR